MPEVIFAGPEGRIEGRYHPQKERDAPIAIVLHPHPAYGGTMNNKVVYNLHYAFYNMGFTVMRFNFRGVGRSQGEYDMGIGELSDAASALDYLQSMNQNSKHCWVAGFSFGGLNIIHQHHHHVNYSPQLKRNVDGVPDVVIRNVHSYIPVKYLTLPLY